MSGVGGRRGRVCVAHDAGAQCARRRPSRRGRAFFRQPSDNLPTTFRQPSDNLPTGGLQPRQIWGNLPRVTQVCKGVAT
jgi:hypothetical protein